MKVLVGAFNKEKALIEAFLGIVKLREGSLTALVLTRHEDPDAGDGWLGLVVVARPALQLGPLDQSEGRMGSRDGRQPITAHLVLPADVGHLHPVDGLPVHLQHRDKLQNSVNNKV